MDYRSWDFFNTLQQNSLLTTKRRNKHYTRRFLCESREEESYKSTIGNFSKSQHFNDDRVKHIQKETWMSMDGGTLNQIDHVLNPDSCKKLKDIRAFHSPEMRSDHTLVAIKVAQQLRKTKP